MMTSAAAGDPGKEETTPQLDERQQRFATLVLQCDLRRLADQNPTTYEIEAAERRMAGKAQSQKQLLNLIVTEAGGKLLRNAPRKNSHARMPPLMRGEYQLICDEINAKANIGLGIEELDLLRLRNEALWYQFRVEQNQKKCVALALNLLCLQAGLSRWPNQARLNRAHAQKLIEARAKRAKDADTPGATPAP